MNLLNLLVFGFLPHGAWAHSQLDRPQVTARVQYRGGPPSSSAVDIVKLLGRNPGTGRLLQTAFLGAPLLGLAGAVTAATLLWMNQLHPKPVLPAPLSVDLLLTVHSLTSFSAASPPGTSGEPGGLP
jgi:formate hydrogenlyase subunit 4